jgi:hypothetical protein
MLLIARIVKHKTIKDTIQWVDMLTSKVESLAKYLFRLASLSSVYQSLTKDFKTPFFDKLGGILLIRSPSSLKYTGEIWGLSRFLLFIRNGHFLQPCYDNELDQNSKG